MPVTSMSNRGTRPSAATTMSSSTPAKLTLTTRNLRSTTSVPRNGEGSGASAYSASPISPARGSLQHQSRLHFKNDMSYSSSSPALSVGSLPKIPSSGSHAKLHKRGASSNSVSGPTSPPTQGLSQFATPYATLEDPFPDVPPSPALSSSVPKIRPYLRKMSSSKEEQGMIDLSKSTSENDQLPGLGIQDFATKSALEVSFTHSRRAHQHGRTTSTGSQVSNASGRHTLTQPFIHPMAKTPRPYTPPAGTSYASSLNDEEANEGDDTVEDEFRLGNGFRTRRSMSISSNPTNNPTNNPTPLSQSQTAVELDLVPKFNSTSQSNLSLASYTSEASKSRKKRPRLNTDRSQEFIPSDSARTSFDKGFSFKPRRSDPNDAQSRDERILAARRKFEEKEAYKDRKQEKEVYKRRESDARREERQRRRSDAQPPLKSALKHSSGNSAEKTRRKSSIATIVAGAEDLSAEKFSRSYEDYRPSNAASLPRYGTTPGESEKTSRFEYVPGPTQSDKMANDGGWMRFSTWLQTRMLSCGGRD